MKRSFFIFCCLYTLIKAHPYPKKVEKCTGLYKPVIGPHYYPQNCKGEEDQMILKRLQSIENIQLDLETNKSSPRNILNITRDGPRGLLDLLQPIKTIIDDYFIHPTTKAVVCTACKSGVLSLQKWLHDGYTQDQMMTMLEVFLCDTLQVVTREYCFDYLGIAAPPLLHILNDTDYEPDVICSLMLVKYCDIPTPPELLWEIPLPEKSSATSKSKIPVVEGKSVLKVLHLADTHVDDKYVEGRWDECGLPLCCRDPAPNNESAKAGKFGGWMCDIPEITFDSMLDFVVNEIKDIDYVIWTGDIPAHDLWAQSKENNLKLINHTITKLKGIFPGENSVVPSIGNHEPVPGNLLPTPDLAEGEWSDDWILGSLSDHWTSGWLPKDKAETIKYGGFYKLLLKPDLLIISINSVFCYYNNWWLVLDNKDPGGELQWLGDSLLEAENLGQKVQIIAHVPPGSLDCLKVWTNNYYRIIERFNETIVGHFFGHTHNDEFQLVPSSVDQSKTAAMFYIGPSVTTYTYVNPGFRIYYIDGDHENTTRKVLDYETWIMDLEASNRDKVAMWKKLYSAKEAFEIESMEPDQWRTVYERIKTDDDYLQQYHRFFWKDSPKRPECDDACKEEYLCSIISCTLYDNL